MTVVVSDVVIVWSISVFFFFINIFHLGHACYSKAYGPPLIQSWTLHLLYKGQLSRPDSRQLPGHLQNSTLPLNCQSSSYSQAPSLFM